MSADPFDSLREPVVPIAPSRPFAAELRRRLAERLGVSARPAPPEGSAAARTDVPDIGAYTPAGHTSIVAGLTCARGADAVAWYVEVFDAVLVEPPYMEDDGRLGHAELRVGNTVFSVADEYPDFASSARAARPASASPSMCPMLGPPTSGRSPRARCPSGHPARRTGRCEPASGTPSATVGTSPRPSPLPTRAPPIPDAGQVCGDRPGVVDRHAIVMFRLRAPEHDPDEGGLPWPRSSSGWQSPSPCSPCGCWPAASPPIAPTPVTRPRRPRTPCAVACSDRSEPRAVLTRVSS